MATTVANNGDWRVDVGDQLSQAFTLTEDGAAVDNWDDVVVQVDIFSSRYGTLTLRSDDASPQVVKSAGPDPTQVVVTLTEADTSANFRGRYRIVVIDPIEDERTTHAAATFQIIGNYTDAAPAPFSAVDLTSHLASSSAHTAANIPVVDSGGYFDGTDTEAVFAEVGASLANNGMTLIASQTLDSSAGSIDFQDLDQDYGDLVVVGRLRLDKAATFGAVNVAVNNDTTNANYLHQLVQIGNATVSPSQNLGTTNSRAPMLVPAASSSSGDFGQFDIEIPNYTSTSEAKDLNFRNNSKIARTSGSILLRNGILAWIATPAAITRLTFSPLDGGVKFVAGSSIRIFGRPASFG